MSDTVLRELSPVATEPWRSPDRHTAPSLAPLPGGLLIATDGTPSADAAVRVGITLACRHGLDAELLTVYEPSPASLSEAIAAVGAEQLDADLRAKQCERVEGQRRRTGADSVVWPLRFEVGSPAPTIARVARSRGDELIVLGLGTHDAFDRVFGRETALQVIRTAGRPVLAVAPDAPTDMPHHVLAAVDFSESSMRSARLALRLLGGSGALTLVHVVPSLPGHPGETEALQQFHAEDARDMLRLARQQLGSPEGVGIRVVVRTGDPTSVLVAFARAAGVDLIATGTHSRSLVQRAVLGSVSTRLLRDAGCSVLVVPEPGAARAD